jgi:hypothetical protein
MLCSVIRPIRKITHLAARSIRRPAHRIVLRLRSLRSRHLQKVSTDAPYAAASAAVLSGLLGLIPMRDVLGAILAAALGVYLKGSQASSGSMPRWDGPYDDYR